MTKEELERFISSKYRESLTLSCCYCGDTFDRIKKNSLIGNKIVSENSRVFCSKTCYDSSNKTEVSKTCGYCEKEISVKLSQLKRSKSGKMFCSISCGTRYNHQHKTHGTTVSKLEKWVQEQLLMLYPGLEFHFNRTDAINSELDIYIPHLKLAFELNGIFHYEPIHGDKKLGNIKNTDSRKFQACLERKIELCIIDTSSSKQFSPKRDQRFLEIIKQVVGERFELSEPFGSEVF